MNTGGSTAQLPAEKSPEGTPLVFNELSEFASTQSIDPSRALESS